MEYATEMGSGSMICILSFIKICSCTEMLIVRIRTQTAWLCHKHIFVFQNKESRLKPNVL